MTYSEFDDVGDFHRKFGLPSVTHEGYGSREVEPDLLAFRIKFLLEELTEFMEATGAYFVSGGERVVHVVTNPDHPIDHALAFDALIDLVYVAYGTAHLFGYPWHQGWALVQEANMAKMRAKRDGSDSKRGSSFDVIKPPGWTAPDIAGLLRECGWVDDKENTL